MVCDRDWLVHCSHRSAGMQLRAAAPLNYRLRSTAALRPPRQARFRLRRCDVPLAPSAGRSGLPKEPAFPADAVIGALMVDAANTSRLENMVASLQRCLGAAQASRWRPPI